MQRLKKSINKMINKVTKKDLILKKWMLETAANGPLNKNFGTTSIYKLNLDLLVVAQAYEVLKTPVQHVDPFWVAGLGTAFWNGLQKSGFVLKKTIAWLKIVKYLLDKDLVVFSMKISNQYFFSAKLRIEDKKKFAVYTKNHI